MSRLSLLACAAVLACLLLPAATFAAAGDPDPAFAGDGSETYPIDTVESSTSRADAVIPQAGGRTLLVGTSFAPVADPEQSNPPRVTLVRLAADGSIDQTYGDDGVVFLPLSAGGDVVDAVQLPGGDIAILANGVSKGQSGAYALSRVTPAGALVDAFGTDGTAVTGYNDFTADPCPPSPPGGCTATAGALALQGSEYLVVGAAVQADGNWGDQGAPLTMPGVARYDLGGDLDLTFGDDDDGTTTLGTPDGVASWGRFTGISAEPAGGKIVLVEEAIEQFTAERTVVHRLEGDGVADTTFDGDGMAVVRFRPDAPTQSSLGERPNAVQILPDGGVAIAGRAYRYLQSGPPEVHAVVARLTSLGALDSTFGAGGVVLEDRGYTGEREFSELELLDGTLYAAGIDRRWEENTYTAPRGLLARFDDDGLDASFGTGGTVTGGDLWGISGLADAGDGFAVVSGWYSYSNDRHWAAARYDLRDSRQPVSVTRPTITNPWSETTIDPGDTATAADGTWRYGDQITRRWQLCGSARTSQSPATDGDCTDIPSATATTYEPVEADRGKHLRVVVTNTNGSFSETAASSTLEVPAQGQPPSFLAPPEVEPSGTVPAGTVVRATWVATGSGPITSTVSWFHCPTATSGPCQPVPQDDTSDDSYTTSVADVGKFLRASVQLRGPAGADSAETSNATGVTAASGATAPAATAAPAIAPAGSVVEGTTLTRSSSGTWNQDGLSLTYRWERCDGGCSGIAGAGGESYTTTGADAGKSVRLVVEARRGDGPVGSAASPATAVTAKPAPQPAPQPAVPAPARQPSGNPYGLTGRVVTQDTTNTKQMPDVRGLQVDAAKQRIEAAGIFADVEVSEVIRAKPLKLPGKDRLDIGDVSGQSLSPGTSVVSSIAQRKAIRLVTEAGPKATKASGGPSGPVCTGSAARADLKGLGLGEVLDLLRAKRCTRVEVDFVVSAGAREVEVRRATKDGKDLALQVTVPRDASRMDLTPVFRQGAFNGRPSFDRETWKLTAGAMNIFGVQVVNRAGITIEDAEVYVDGSKVGAEDIDDRARGKIFVRGFRPEKAGVVNVLVAQSDAEGNRIFGFGRFQVADRSGPFVAIDGQRYTANGARAASVARAAGFAELLGGIGKLLGDLGAGVQRMFAGGFTEQTLSSAAKKDVGLAHIALGDILSGGAGVVSAGGANVVAAGGANVVAAGGANVVSAGGGNAISMASGQVIAAGGGNVIGKESMRNGSGSLLPIPSQVIAAGGGNVIAVGGGNVIAAGGGNVIAAGGGNVIAAGGGNVVAPGGGN